MTQKQSQKQTVKIIVGKPSRRKGRRRKKVMKQVEVRTQPTQVQPFRDASQSQAGFNLYSSLLKDEKSKLDTRKALLDARKASLDTVAENLALRRFAPATGAVPLGVSPFKTGSMSPPQVKTLSEQSLRSPGTMMEESYDQMREYLKQNIRLIPSKTKKYTPADIDALGRGQGGNDPRGGDKKQLLKLYNTVRDIQRLTTPRKATPFFDPWASQWQGVPSTLKRASDRLDRVFDRGDLKNPQFLGDDEDDFDPDARPLFGGAASQGGGGGGGRTQESPF